MASAATYHVRLADSGAEALCRAGESVLQAFERRGGNAVRIGCRSGGCGVCRIHVLHGRCRAEGMSARHVSAEERAVGYVLACRAYPESDLVIEAAPRDTVSIPTAPATAAASPPTAI